MSAQSVSTGPAGRVASVSVVVPTLGGDSLQETIDWLNRGTVPPSEILICIPKEDAFRVKHLSGDTLKILETSTRGQVSQRAAGFAKASQRFVLQLDDDIIVHEECLETLLSALVALGPGNAVGPVLMDLITGANLHKSHTGGVRGFFKSLYAYLICGAPWGSKRMGSMTPLAVGYGVDPAYCHAPLCETDWLPGSCVLGYRHELITEDFYPFSGKAYLEDAIHSFLRKQNQLKHWVIPKAICKTVFQTPSAFDLASLGATTRARFHAVQLISGKSLRLSLFLILDFLKRVSYEVLKPRRSNSRR